MRKAQKTARGLIIPAWYDRTGRLAPHRRSITPAATTQGPPEYPRASYCCRAPNRKNCHSPPIAGLSPQVSGLFPSAPSPQLSSLSHQASALRSQASAIKPQVSGLKPQVSGLKPQPSSLRSLSLSPQVSSLRSLSLSPLSLSSQLSFKKVSTSACCKPDFVRLPPKRLAVRSFIYPTEVKFPPKRDATYPES